MLVNRPHGFSGTILVWFWVTIPDHLNTWKYCLLPDLSQWLGGQVSQIPTWIVHSLRVDTACRVVRNLKHVTGFRTVHLAL